MKLEQLQKLANDKKISLVCMLPEEARTSILRRAMFTADCNEYQPDYDRIIDDVDNCTLAELDPLFEAYKEALEQVGQTDETVEKQYFWYSDRIKNHNAPRKPEITEAENDMTRTTMTVLEVVKGYGLEGFSKRYKNVYGNFIPLPNLAELSARPVKSVEVFFPSNTVTITLLDSKPSDYEE